jgi:hypothetical protein
VVAFSRDIAYHLMLDEVVFLSAKAVILITGSIVLAAASMRRKEQGAEGVIGF